MANQDPTAAERKRREDQASEARKGGDPSTDPSSTVVDEVLRKSLERLGAIVDSSPDGRKKLLLSKSLNDQATPAEHEELRAILAGTPPTNGGPAAGAPDLISKGMRDDASGAISGATNASKFLEAFHNNITSAMGELGQLMAKSESRQDERLIILAKGLYDIGTGVLELAKSQRGLDAKLEAVLRQPQRPRSAGGQPGQLSIVNRQIGAGAGPGDGGANANPNGAGQPRLSLSKSEGFTILEALLAKAEKAKDDEAVNKYVLAISQYEQTNRLPPSVEQEVRAAGRQMFGLASANG